VCDGMHIHLSNTRHYLVYGLVTILTALTLFVWSAVLASDTGGKLVVAFLDVGQGDAIFIQAPNGTQVLIDGGKGSTVLSELGTLMPFSDRTIDTVIATHPDLDHIGGLPEVFARYEVGMFLEPGVADDGADYDALKKAVQDEGLAPVYARPHMTLALDQGVFIEFLFPDRDVPGLEANMGSVVARLVYGNTSVMLTGDSPMAIEEYLVSRYGEGLKSDLLKLGHHGSKTASSETFLGYVDPAYGIVSAGCDNSYGHPHEEVLDRLATFEVKKLSTCEEGTIVFESDGVEWVRR
jgi:competence protein ComEC